jgi:hypothetical protein
VKIPVGRCLPPQPVEWGRKEDQWGDKYYGKGKGKGKGSGEGRDAGWDSCSWEGRPLILQAREKKRIGDFFFRK